MLLCMCFWSTTVRETPVSHYERQKHKRSFTSALMQMKAVSIQRY